MTDAQRSDAEILAGLPKGDFVLLVNTRLEKGFDLILEVALLCPDIPFVAIASQSSRDLADKAIAGGGQTNITIIDKVEDMAPLYRRARAVAVPSYRFKETFSRVCIEAQRYSKPVLGATSANIPYLLEQSGIIMEEDAEAWAAELTRLYEDDAYYAERQALADENSIRYSQSNQRQSFHNILDTLDTSVLIGVGSGIGNVLHCGPMIRNIARRLGRRVDIVVAVDHPGSLFLLHHLDYVGSVYQLSETVLEKYYDTVFLTHSFGMSRMTFNARRVLRSRDWGSFTPGKSSHETLFNLEAAEALLDVPFEDADIEQHYIGDIEYTWPAAKIVGIHGGSKTGYWASKRWGGFNALADKLAAQGYEVCSFGTPDEYIPGTRDLTGGSIEEMAQAMRQCSYFCSNDSGVMNIANALGIPVLSVFAPTEIATRKPLRAWNVAIGVDKACAPCEVTDPKLFKSGGCTCIDEISVDKVLGGFSEMVARVTDIKSKEPTT